jgi:hypothetical protein
MDRSEIVMSWWLKGQLKKSTPDGIPLFQITGFMRNSSLEGAKE